MQQRRQVRVAFHEQPPCAAGSVELVCGIREQMDAFHIHRYMPEGLHGVGVEKCAVFMRNMDDFMNRLQNAGFVVGPLHAPQRSIGADGTCHCFRMDHPVCVRQNQRYINCRDSGGFQHGDVLDGRNNGCFPHAACMVGCCPL